MRRRKLTLFFAVAMALTMAFATTLKAAEYPEDEKILRAVKKVVEQHERLSGELEKLKSLLGLGTTLEGLTLLEGEEGMSEDLRKLVKKGTEEFNAGKGEEAKETFQQAWEEDSNNAVLNYNLGLSYHKIGNIPLAKKMFKVAIEKKPDIKGAAKIKTYLTGKAVGGKISKADALSEEEKKIRNEIINLRKEAESYMKSQAFSHPVKKKSVVHALDKMAKKAENSKKLIREFYVSIADTYALYQMYDKALGIFGKYEKSMEGEVFPDNYYTEKLKVEERKKNLDKDLAAYRENAPDDDIKRKLSRDLRELEIFGAQLEEFVATPSKNDADFIKICQRLGEYRWGNRPDRHVIIVNRYEELLFSSLPGTLPVDRYRDSEGKAFLKNITHMAEAMSLKHTEFFTVDLNVQGTILPYVVMYTYVPKHEAFIIVRLPRKDLI